MKKKIIISLVLVIIFLVFGFFYWFKYIKPGTKIDLCDKFPEVPGEISCQEAGNIALAEYSGEVYGVEKTILYTEIEFIIFFSLYSRCFSWVMRLVKVIFFFSKAMPCAISKMCFLGFSFSALKYWVSSWFFCSNQ